MLRTGSRAAYAPASRQALQLPDRRIIPRTAARDAELQRQQ
jgi:hypothetical protein